MIQLSKPLKPVVLVILDGWGVAPESAGNAITLAHLPYFHSINVSYPHTVLEASGPSVGLPSGEAGNSEVGHLNIGAGKIVYQDLPRINSAIADGSFLKNETFKRAFDHVKTNKSNLHLMGLVGTGNVHASVEHLYALLWAAKEAGLQNVFLHLFTDGRDSSPTSGLQLIAQIEYKISTIGVGKIASVMGRYWAMDRDQRWERTKRAYEALVNGQASLATSPRVLIQSSYSKKVTDEFIEPTLIAAEGKTITTVRNGDSLIFFNFRPDQARELTKSLTESDFQGFSRKIVLKDLYFVCMAEYDSGSSLPVAFPHHKINEPLSRVISNYSLKQLHIGETEKYAHVTYFFNGGREEPFLLEDRVHISSPKVSTYDLKPQMSAGEITDYVSNKLRGNVYEFYVVNFANADMVAHTGSIDATIKAVEFLDTCLRVIGREVLLKNGAMIVTADHGNAEAMLNAQTGGVDTEHSTNKVPFIVVANEFNHSSTLQFPSGILADVAPTVLSLMGLPKGVSMFGQDLLEVKVLNKALLD